MDEKPNGIPVPAGNDLIDSELSQSKLQLDCHRKPGYGAVTA